MEHSIRFPLPFGIHVGFVIFSIIMLILCYKKKKYAYDLYMLIGIASTMLIYVSESKPFFYILGLEEIILFAITIADMAKVSKKLKAEEKERLAAKENQDNADDTAKSEMTPQAASDSSDESKDNSER